MNFGVFSTARNPAHGATRGRHHTQPQATASSSLVAPSNAQRMARDPSLVVRSREPDQKDLDRALALRGRSIQFDLAHLTRIGSIEVWRIIKARNFSMMVAAAGRQSSEGI